MLKKYLLIIILIFPFVSYTQIVDAKNNEKDFGIKGFILNKNYANQKTDNCTTKKIKSISGDILNIEDCISRSSILEEEYAVNYKTLNGIIYQVVFLLQDNEVEVKKLSKIVPKYFVEKNNFILTDNSSKTKEDFSKYTNTLVARINEEFGKFIKNNKSESKAYRVEYCTNPEFKKIRMEFDRIMRFNTNRGYRYETLRDSLLPQFSTNEGLISAWLCFPVIDTCNNNCLVHLYNFEWVNKDSIMNLKVHMPENKKSYYFNYDVDITYKNVSITQNIELWLKNQEQFEVNQKKILEEEEEKLKKIKNEELQNEINRKKENELNNKKKDF
jgi:hypothetical protein